MISEAILPESPIFSFELWYFTWGHKSGIVKDGDSLSVSLLISLFFFLFLFYFYFSLLFFSLDAILNKKMRILMSL